MRPKAIGIVGFDGVIGIDLVGPAEAFSLAELPNGPSNALEPCYKVIIIGISKRPFTSGSGITFQPGRTLQTAPPLDTLIIPGGKGLRQPHISKQVSAFVRARARNTRRIASVCTGLYGLAHSGLLGRRNVTTHWRFAADVVRKFPDLHVNDNAIFLKDGPFYTSAGATAGIDLALHLIEEDYGPQIALRVARDLVVYLKRSGGQEQYSEPLQFQTQSTDRFADLTTWIVSHLNMDLSVDALAAKAFLCPRQFTRRFKAAFHYTPADFVEKLRLDEARRRLSMSHSTIVNIGASLGYKNVDTFRRAFERRVGITPADYRDRFSNSNGDFLPLHPPYPKMKTTPKTVVHA